MRNSFWSLVRTHTLLFAALIAATIGSGVFAGSAEARRGDRTLKLHFTHTGERGEFTYKRGGRYDRKVLKELNTFLRDWRQNEPTQMDPQLFDVVWEVYRQTGSREYIHVVSAYRSLKTNNKLRSRSRGVAKKSQHTLGKALDFYIPGVSVAKIRKIAFKLEAGGVGYYPTSGTPFVHLDTGNVRSWPRMTRKQLIALFPDQKTLHLPSDGKPLAGYNQAVAKRKSQSGKVAVAYLDSSKRSISRGGGRDGDNGNVSGWLKKVFTGGADGDEDRALEPAKRTATTQVASAQTAPAAPSAKSVLAPPIQPYPRPQTSPPVQLAAAETRPSAEESATLARLAFAEIGLDQETAGATAAIPSGPLVPYPVPEKTRLLHMAANARALELAATQSVTLASADQSLRLQDASDLRGTLDRSLATGSSQQTFVANSAPANQLQPAQQVSQVDAPAVFVPEDGDRSDALTALYAAAAGPDPNIDRPQLASLIVSSDDDVATGRMQQPVLSYASATPDSRNLLALISTEGNDEPAAQPTEQQKTVNAESSKRDLEAAGGDMQAKKLAGDDLRLMMSENSTRTQLFGQLTEPQPIDANSLYMMPDDLSEVLAHRPNLRTDRFIFNGTVSGAAAQSAIIQRVAFRN